MWYLAHHGVAPSPTPSRHFGAVVNIGSTVIVPDGAVSRKLPEHPPFPRGPPNDDCPLPQIRSLKARLPSATRRYAGPVARNMPLTPGLRRPACCGVRSKPDPLALARARC